MSLAETLSCTLHELKSRVTEEELILWQLHFSRKAELQAKEMEKIKRQSRSR
jgi:hypothetical protein